MSALREAIRILLGSELFLRKILQFADVLEISEATKLIVSQEIRRGPEYSELLGRILKEWGEIEGADFSTNGLVEMLREIECNGVADSLEETFPTSITLKRLSKDRPNVAPGKEEKKPKGVDSNGPLEVKVIPRKGFLGGAGDYSLCSKPRGRVLIVNNMEFDNPKANRPGAEKDELIMNSLFEQLGFQVEIKNNVKDKTDLKKCFQSFKDGGTADCCVVILMSHGQYDSFQLCNGSSVHILKDIVYQFDHEKAEMFKGKPKVFIFQSCRVFQKDSMKEPRQLSDTVVCYSTLPGDVAYRDPIEGSPYIRTLAQVLMNDAATSDFMTMLRNVAVKMMGNRYGETVQQTPGTCIFGEFKNLYFNPVVGKKQ